MRRGKCDGCWFVDRINFHSVYDYPSVLWTDKNHLTWTVLKCAPVLYSSEYHISSTTAARNPNLDSKLSLLFHVEQLSYAQRGSMSYGIRCMGRRATRSRDEHIPSQALAPFI